MTTGSGPSRLLLLEDARTRLIQAVTVSASEMVGLHKSVGRTAAGALVARHDQPPFRASAMDGYAVRRTDGCPWLTVVGEAAAGHPFERPLASGEAVRIGTGAPLPAGADHILIQEEAERLGDRIRATAEQAVPCHVREVGRDFHRGDLLLPAGGRVEARHIGLLAAAGHVTVNVRRRPAVGVITAGDELADPGDARSTAQIVDSGGVALSALARDWGADCVWIGRAADRLEDTVALWRTARTYDLVVSVGGASVGHRDLLRSGLEAAGGRVSWAGMAIRPGKPTWMGELGGKPILGLPGNPAAAAVMARLLLRPAIDAMLGRDATDRPLAGRLDTPMAANGWREAHERSERHLSEDGSVRLRPVADGDSSRLSPFVTANALIVRSPNAEQAAFGDLVAYRII